MYGVGYPVLDNILGGKYVLGFVIALLFAKMLATSLTLSIGGSGGVFAPSLFVGAATGAAFGTIAHHIFGSAAGSPVIYSVVAMGGVFAGSTQAPLTAVASVAEMSANFTLTIPILIVCGIAAATSKRLGYANIYTQKLLRRGVDLEAAGAGGVVWQDEHGEHAAIGDQPVPESPEEAERATAVQYPLHADDGAGPEGHTTPGSGDDGAPEPDADPLSAPH